MMCPKCNSFMNEKSQIRFVREHEKIRKIAYSFTCTNSDCKHNEYLESFAE